MAIIRACNQVYIFVFPSLTDCLTLSTMVQFSGARYRIRYTDEGGNIKEGEFPQEVIRAPRGAE